MDRPYGVDRGMFVAAPVCWGLLIHLVLVHLTQMSESGLPSVPKTWREAVPYITWAALVIACGYVFIEKLVEASYGEALTALIIGLGAAALALHSKTWLERTNPNWIYPAVFILVCGLLVFPYFKENRWPFTVWFPHTYTPDEIAEAVIHKMPIYPSTSQIADAVGQKLSNPASVDKIAEAIADKLPASPTADQIAETISRKVLQTMPDVQIIDYGVDGPNRFHITVDFKNWQEYKDFKAVLINRTAFVDRDRMTDDWIAKSIAYTINGPMLKLATINNNQMHFSGGDKSN